jgi:hypothetical protein
MTADNAIIIAPIAKKVSVMGFTDRVYALTAAFIGLRL